MKYILTESQAEAYRFLRRIDSDHQLMKEIIVEGLDLYDPCQFSFDDFLHKILHSSAETLLFSYYELNFLKGEIGETLMKFTMKYMDDSFRNLIFDYYDDYEC